MNERIKELADKSGLYIAYDNREVTDKEIESFAELIVRECALVVFKKTGPKSALDVLEHFGVEE